MSIARNLSIIQDRIRRACDSVNRDPAEITLIAVTKTVSADDIKLAYDLGHRCFGESRLQEAQPKIEQLPNDIDWHFIGHLQSNKAKKVTQLFDCIHTLDSEAQLKEIVKANREIRAFIEVNIAEEMQKAGILTESLDEFAATVLHYPQVHLAGLMTIGPATDDLAVTRKCFRELKSHSRRLGLSKLSMGMSGDFEVAIQEGATHIRVGSAIFGSRN